ncbi:hypothetical protein J437_LFUL006102 [Ladona fulva]|uniref:Uncharacterized protein n=1 Tax=Ladona fulva TaxID=123851 RepID=A0A8K0K868_LADFU|nr:hypothetical protein J437_LFUL006102 [Ladona fulva]
MRSSVFIKLGENAIKKTSKAEPSLLDQELSASFRMAQVLPRKSEMLTQEVVCEDGAKHCCIMAASPVTLYSPSANFLMHKTFPCYLCLPFFPYLSPRAFFLLP